MRQQRSRIANVLAGCMAAMMAFGGGTAAVFASSEENAPMILTVYDDDDVTLEISEDEMNPVLEPPENVGEFDAPGATDIEEVSINKNTFPDANFRSYVKSAFDKNGDSYLDKDEILVARNIHCENLGIKSLKGIEYLVELRGLYCMFNQIETMDLSKNKLITGVWCSNNKFTTLDFSANPDLEWVYCYECKLTSLNISNNPKMAYVEVNTNPLKTLDVTHNPLLEHLTCGSCELSSLDLSNNPKLSHLDAFRNHFTSLDLSHNPLMKRLDIWDNVGLGNVDISMLKGLQVYNCAHNNVTVLDVSNNPELIKLLCSWNSISSLNVTNNPKLLYLACGSNSLSSLDISKNYKLYHLEAYTNPFSSLIIGNNRLLVKTYQEGKYADEPKLGPVHSWTIEWGGDTSTGDDNVYMLCVDKKVTLDINPTGPIPTPTPLPDPIDTRNLISREMVVQTLYNMAGCPSVSGLTTKFTDVVPGSWYYDALLWGEANLIAIGYPDVSDTKFGVGEWVTRQDVAFMLMRYAELVGYQRSIDFGRTDPYIDYYEIDYYAWEAVTWAVTWNIMEGKGIPGAPKDQQRIDPHGRATTTELETMILNRLEKNNKPAIQVPIPANPYPQKEANFADFIERLYNVALNRSSDPSGLDFWMNKVLNEGFTGADCARGFLIESPEFGNRGLNDDEFLYALYSTFFNRYPDDGGYSFWKQKLSEGMSRAQVIEGFIDSVEWCNLCSFYGVKSGAPTAKSEKASNNAIKFATRLYTECLGRNPESQGLEFWALRLTNMESSGYEAARDFFESREFRNKNVDDATYVKLLYRTFMGRDYDDAGLQFWLEHLATDMNRQQVLQGFAQSQEFTNICNEYGIARGNI